MTFGPPQIIAEKFAGVAGVARLLLFGSWTARYHGEPGSEPGDIDVAVIGTPGTTPDRADERAQRRLVRPVNPTVLTARRWAARDPEDALLTELLHRPTMEIDRFLRETTSTP